MTKWRIEFGYEFAIYIEAYTYESACEVGERLAKFFGSPVSGVIGEE